MPQSFLSFFPFRSAASKQIIQRITDHTYETTMSYSTNFTAPISNLTVWTQTLMKSLTEIKKPSINDMS